MDFVLGGKEEDLSNMVKLTRTVENDCIAYRDAYGNLHKSNGPARIWFTGPAEHLDKGEYHREEKPAAFYPRFNIYWYTHGNIMGIVNNL